MTGFGGCPRSIRATSLGAHDLAGRGAAFTFLDARWARKVENVSALVAYAVDPDGHRRLLAITLGPEESEDSWSELLEQLLERGLSGGRTAKQSFKNR